MGRSTPPLELLQIFRATGGADKKKVMTSSLIREARAGDEAVIQLLPKTNIDVNDAEMYSCYFHDQRHTDGSSALDQILQLSRLWCPQQINRLCFYADCEESAKANEGEHQSHVSAAQRLKRKLFIGGLPPSVDSDVYKRIVAEFANDKRQCSIWDRAKGTTNIAVRLDKEAVVGFDSRITYAGQRRDTEIKFTRITSKILATMAGNVGECKKTWKQMEEHVSENVPQGEEPTSIEEIAKVAYNMERTNDDAASECFIVGVQNEKPEIHYLLDDYDEGLKIRAKKLKEIKRFSAIGSGSTYAHTELQKEFKDPERRLSLEETVELVKYGLLLAALSDCFTGGPLWVVHVNSEGIMIKSENNVVGLYVRFYDRFRGIEERSIFLFYIPEVNKKLLDKKLREKGRVVDRGHPLTQLKGRYYIHRVVFQNEAAATLLLDEAQRVSKSNRPPFTDWPQLKVMNIGKNIFLAKQSRELLLTLRLATSDEEAPESLPNPEASGN